MAEAQYETCTRTVEETFVVLRLTEDEADTLRSILDGYSGPNSVSIRSALAKPATPETSADTTEYRGVTYDVAARYVDKDGDVWRFQRLADGVVRGRWTDGPIAWHHAGLSEVVDEMGPLTKVTS